MKYARFVSATALIVVLSASLLAQQPAEPRKAQAAKSTAKVESPATPKPQADYSGEAFVVEKMYSKSRFEADGTGASEVFVRAKIQSDGGVQAFGQLVYSYSSANEAMDVEFVRVIKPNGQVITAGADAVQDLTSQVTRQAPVYTDLREKHITVPSLRPGDILEYKIVTKLHTPLAPNHFWTERSFVRQGIILDERFEVDTPANRAVKLACVPEYQPQITEEHGRKIYRWQTARLEKDADDDDDNTPAAKARKKKRLSTKPDIQLTTFSDWAEIGKWYAGLERERRKPTPEIEAKAKALTAGLASDMEKIQALYDYVATNYRYVSLSFGVGRYQPHAAGDVFGNQYGDCKDKHTLLASLLTAAGYKVNSVLINSSRKLDPAIPSPAQFDHVITQVIVGNEPIWLDTTPEVGPFRLLTFNLRNKQALVIPQDGVASLQQTPKETFVGSYQKQSFDGEVNDYGKLSGTFTLETRGDAEVLMRSIVRRVPRTEWKKFGQAILAQVVSAQADVTDFQSTDPAATHEPFKMEVKCSVPNFVDWSRQKSRMTLPTGRVDLVVADEDGNEDGILEIGFDSTFEYVDKIKLPAVFTVRPPLPISVKRDYAEFVSSYTVQDQLLTANRKLVRKASELPKARYADYTAFSRAVNADNEQRVSLESTVAEGKRLPETTKVKEAYDAGVSAYNAGRYDVSAELLKRVVEKEPDHKHAWNDLGRAQMMMNRLDESVKSFQKAVELNPYDEYAHNNMGLALQRQNKYEEAITAFKKQIEVSPLDQYAHANLGQLYLARKRYVEAVEPLERAVTINTNNGVLQVSLGQAYLNTGQKEKALAAFDKAANASPNPTVWNNIAYELAQSKLSLDRAQKYAESAVSYMAAVLRNLPFDPADKQKMMAQDGAASALASFWDTLGWVKFQQGDLESAFKYISASYILSEHGDVADHMGQIYEKMGDKLKARKAYAMALQGLHPSDEAREHLKALDGTDSAKLDTAKLDKLKFETASEAVKARTYKLKHLPRETASAEFYVAFEPGVDQPDVRFASGSEKLKGLAEEIKTLPFSFKFPDSTPTRIVRQGVLFCSKDVQNQCSLSLAPLNDGMFMAPPEVLADISSSAQ